MRLSKFSIANLMAIAPALLSGIPAFAADYSAPASPTSATNWNGVYAGLNAGYVATLDGSGPYCINPAGIRNGPGCSFNLDSSLHSQLGGFIGGGQIGYNWQSNIFLAGVEADLQGTTANGATTQTFINPLTGSPGQTLAASKLDYLGTVRARIGVLALDQLLVYVTGGLAYGGGNVSSNFASPAFAAAGVMYPSTQSFNRTGWTIGGGVEYALAPNWSITYEVLYYDLGQASTLGSNVIPPANAFREGKVFNLNGVIGRVGVNYKFDLSAPSVPVIMKY